MSRDVGDRDRDLARAAVAAVELAEANGQLPDQVRVRPRREKRSPEEIAEDNAIAAAAAAGVRTS